MKEVWKSLDEFPDYIISNKGNILSLPGKYNGRVLKPRKTKVGHLQVCLQTNGTKKWMYVHRLVALAFLKKKKLCNVVMHTDDNKENNCVQNLKWGTQLQNMRWIYKKSPFTQLDNKKKYVYDSINYICENSNIAITKAFKILGEKHNKSHNTMMQYYYQYRNNL